MAIGYGKIIIKSYEGYYRDLLNDIERDFQLFIPASDNIYLISDLGEVYEGNSNELYYKLFTHKQVTFKITNLLKEQIAVSIGIIDNYLIEETYSMDEIIEVNGEDMLLFFLRNRFNDLLTKRRAIGFIFDEEGYSEDYILIPPPNWQSSNECWRKLMGG